jgi:hypothetical protein
MTSAHRTLLAAGFLAAIAATPARATGGWTWDVREGDGPPALTYGPPGSVAVVGVTCANASGTVTLDMEADPARAGALPDGGEVAISLKGPTGTAEASGRYDAEAFAYVATLASPTAFADLIRRKGWLDVAVGAETFSVEVDDRAMSSRDRFETLCKAAGAARP